MKNRLKEDLIHISAIGRPSGCCIASIEDLDPKEALRILMSRDLRQEHDED